MTGEEPTSCQFPRATASVLPSIFHHLRDIQIIFITGSMNHVLSDNISYRRRFMEGSGISALMTSLTLSGDRKVSLFASQKRVCACGRPRFWYSVPHTLALLRPKQPLRISCMRLCSLRWKTVATRSGRTLTVWSL